VLFFSLLDEKQRRSMPGSKQSRRVGRRRPHCWVAESRYEHRVWTPRVGWLEQDVEVARVRRTRGANRRKKTARD